MITNNIKENIIKILNIFEQGTAENLYDRIYFYHDGTGNKIQTTLSRGFTECGGSLWEVIKRYKDKGGKNGDLLLSYKPNSCKEILPNDRKFINLLIESSKSEKIMRDAQDEVYDEVYWKRGQKWFDNNKFTLPLSMAVIQDSFLQSGTMLDFLINRFREKTPKNSGNEKRWIEDYVNVRHNWLKNHSRKVLNNTIYRTRFFKEQIENNNWNLDKFPLKINGVYIDS